MLFEEMNQLQDDTERSYCSTCSLHNYSNSLPDSLLFIFLNHTLLTRSITMSQEKNIPLTQTNLAFDFPVS